MTADVDRCSMTVFPLGKKLGILSGGFKAFAESPAPAKMVRAYESFIYLLLSQ
jgi:hypothetical protein